MKIPPKRKKVKDPPTGVDLLHKKKEKRGIKIGACFRLIFTFESIFWSLIENMNKAKRIQEQLTVAYILKCCIRWNIMSILKGKERDVP